MFARSASIRSIGLIAALTVALCACSAMPGITTGPTTSLSPTGAATPGISPTPSRAPAEGQIVFVDNKGASSHAQLYVERADGTQVRRLVTSDFDDQGPALSQDGRKVAFTRYAPEGSTEGGVFIVNIDGTGLRRIDTNGEDVSWSPDGSQLVETRALVEGDGAAGPYNVALWIVEADGSGVHQVTLKGLRCMNVCANGAQDNEARFSPDGKRVAFLRDTYTSPEQYSVFTIAIDGSDLRRVTPVGMEVGNPHWSPDGTRILFQSPKEPVSHGEQNIYVINGDGTGLTQLTAHLPSSPSGVQGTFHPCFSPDGNLIVFSHYPGSVSDRASLYLMNADGSDMHLLAQTNLDQNGAEWGPLPTSG
jgi:Tol biopolymer transport system component